ncbi:hypothetical protein F5877DRAFT_53614 [Lentinula edodes]|nr:hypothetical protein F5877DRAFT_53614 [Lentinula edodes]
MLSPEFIEDCVRTLHEAVRVNYDPDQILFPAVVVTSDPHAVSETEAQFYYGGLHSAPRLLYRTGKKWIQSCLLEPPDRSKELVPVFNHPITKVWNDDLGWEIIRFTTIDVVRFRAPEPLGNDEYGYPVLSPVTIWVGVFPGSVTATAAHDVAQILLDLLKVYQITDVDIDFRESFYMSKSGPQLLKPVRFRDPVVDVVSPLTPSLGLHISTRARPNTEGTMALYLAKGDGSNDLLGLSCRHVLIGRKEANVDYVCHPGGLLQDVLLFGKRSYANLVQSIKVRIADHSTWVELWEEWQKDPANENDKYRSKIESSLEAMEALGALYEQVNKNWKRFNNRILGHIICSPALRLGVGEQRFTEDWGIFSIDRTKLGDGFQGNHIDLGPKGGPDEFYIQCFSDNWQFAHDPLERLLPLESIIPDSLMHTPDMWDVNHEPCLVVVKNGNATGTTYGRANGPFSIVRTYFLDMSIHQTSMEWGIMNYGYKVGVFSEPGDSGSIIADLRGRIGGMITGGAGHTKGSDLTYATPFWWLLERIKANGFPDVHLGVVA